MPNGQLVDLENSQNVYKFRTISGLSAPKLGTHKKGSLMIPSRKIPRRFQSDPSPRPGRVGDLREPRLDKTLYAALLEVRNLLEAYAPSWYSDALRQKLQVILQHEP